MPVRQLDVLPWETISDEYANLLAFGSTVEGTLRLVERLGGRVVALAFLVELPAYGGRRRLGEHRVQSLLSYEYVPAVHHPGATIMG